MTEQKLSLLLRVQYKELPEIIIQEVERLENQIEILENEPTYDDAINSMEDGLDAIVIALGLPAEYFDDDVAAGAAIDNGLKRIANCLCKFGFHFDEDEAILTTRADAELKKNILAIADRLKDKDYIECPLCDYTWFSDDEGIKNDLEKFIQIANNPDHDYWRYWDENNS